MRTLITSVVFLVAATSATTAGAWPAKQKTHAKAAKAALVVTSSAFKNGEAIPREYTCDGADTTPPIEWSKVPAGTKSFAILAEDPDAPGGPFTHWLVTGIPASTTRVEPGAKLPGDAAVSLNSKGLPGYTGPCPTATGAHHYVFHVYALDIPLSKPMTRQELETAMRGHVLAQGQLTGTYQRSQTAPSR